MDPITIALITIGAGALIAMVFYLIYNAALYLTAVIAAVAQVAAIEAYTLKMEERVRYEMENQRQKSTYEMEEQRRKLQELLEEIRQEKAKLEKEETIAKAIDSIVSGSPASIVLNIGRLIKLIYESYILKNNLKNPDESVNAVRQRVQYLERKLKDLELE
jgi:membrane protein implicated in regulation of membrane protease activity